MKEIQRYRGVRLAHVITICEGEGTPDSISRLVDYVLLPSTGGNLVSYGKVIPLTQEEKDFIGNDELK